MFKTERDSILRVWKAGRHDLNRLTPISVEQFLRFQPVVTTVVVQVEYVALVPYRSTIPAPK